MAFLIYYSYSTERFPLTCMNCALKHLYSEYYHRNSSNNNNLLLFILQKNTALNNV